MSTPLKLETADLEGTASALRDLSHSTTQLSATLNSAWGQLDGDWHSYCREDADGYFRHVMTELKHMEDMLTQMGGALHGTAGLVALADEEATKYFLVNGETLVDENGNPITLLLPETGGTPPPQAPTPTPTPNAYPEPGSFWDWVDWILGRGKYAPKRVILGPGSVEITIFPTPTRPPTPIPPATSTPIPTPIPTQTPAPTAVSPSTLDILDISDNGLSLIKGYEGFVAGLYNDPVGHCTVGYGHLVHLGNCDGRESELLWKDGITDEQATALLKADVASSVQAVKNNVTVPLTQNQFDALVDFVFNVGEGALQSSDLLAKLNAGDYDSVPSELARWNKGADASGNLVELEGLTNRRKEEGELFNKP
jgi:GH24 family phage-related lysozyme (muramidase)